VRNQHFHVGVFLAHPVDIAYMYVTMTYQLTQFIWTGSFQVTAVTLREKLQ